MKQADRQTDIQTYINTDRQTDIQTNRHNEILFHSIDVYAKQIVLCI